ncbi:MAG: alpha amylase, partial [bacterium]
PDHFLLAEWDDPAIHRVGFHAGYDWEWYRALRAVARWSRQAADLSILLARRSRDFPEGAIPMRFVENHDEPRAPRRLGTAARGAELFAALAGGSFLVYNGQEIGARHRPDLFNRDPIGWQPPAASRFRARLRELLDFRRRVAGFSAPEAIGTNSPGELAVFRRRGPSGELVVLLNAGSSPIGWPPGLDAPRGDRLLAGVDEKVAEAWIPGDRIPARSAIGILSC